MHPLNHNSDKALWVIIFIFALFFAGNFIFTQLEVSQLKNEIASLPTNAPASVLNTLNPVTTPVASSSPITSPTATPVLTPTPKPSQTNPPIQITYIPLSGGNTQNTDWVIVSGSQFTFNFGDYGSRAYAVWDANLRVDNANGETFARLFDTTHAIAVNGSEINISSTAISTDIISGQLSFWAGNNTYVVQLKSLNGSTAFMDSGRIKISY